MSSISSNGWAIYFHQIFFDQLADQIACVKKLKSRMSNEEFITHPEVKMLQTLRKCIKQEIPNDPFASRFHLNGILAKYSRVKHLGIPSRYRLFFRASAQSGHKAIFILWLGFPRKKDSKDDCYEVFKKMVSRGNFPENVALLIAASETSPGDF